MNDADTFASILYAGEKNEAQQSKPTHLALYSVCGRAGSQT